MIGGVIGDIGAVDFGSQAEIEAERAKIAGRDGSEAESITVLLGIHPRDRVGEFEPGTIETLEGEVADEVADAGDGEGFVRGSRVTERGGLEVGAGDLGRDADLEDGGGSGVRRQQEAGGGEQSTQFPENEQHVF